ncbi:hypothetical protein K431DRAFT_281271 [Polychaeton citri CBS 116435]|uniref:Uncharacterized protein n=1 Tax=Polychaeton citri CBS 116435 TaxID=1314669 RepID=A0A9P4QIE0_9PEZI|nr:hypothetical protein K431DRAFT_281271 [Polychaeton citri CBS 116435]
MASATTVKRIDSAVVIDDDIYPPLHQINKATTILSLPAEIRIVILEYVFEDNRHDRGFANYNTPGGITVNDEYTVTDKLLPLFTCRQMHQDGTLLALNRTNFMVTNLFFNIPERLQRLHPKQIEAVRNIAFVADQRHFRKLKNEWHHAPFGLANLYLDTVTIILHRSSFWHYLFDFTQDFTLMLRQLRNVKRFVFVKNAALVKGSFKTWCNRLVGLILKHDHHMRYDRSPPEREEVWWEWSFDEVSQVFELAARPPKKVMEEAEYMEFVKPLMERLRISIENEEWNPDPRSRNGF